jgi:hypothetical protein
VVLNSFASLSRRYFRRRSVIVTALLSVVVLTAIASSSASAALPTATIEAPPRVSYTSAELQATVDPGGESTFLEFQVIPEQRYQENLTEGLPGFEGARAVFGEAEIAGPVIRPVNELSPDTEYRVRLLAFNASGNAESGTTTFQTLFAPAPTVTISPATSITANRAHLSGTINPQAPEEGVALFDVKWEFVCRPSCHVSGGGEIYPDASSHTVEATASGLAAGTEYTIELIATNELTSVAAEESFTTPTVGPTVHTLPAFAIEGGTEALIGASINPQNSPTVYWLEYGPTTAYGAALPVTKDASAGAGIEAIVVSRRIAGLSPSTVYHMRVMAENGIGSSEGEDLTFETAPPTSPVSQICPNQAVRIQQSMQQLPDCRGYELVTPLDTNGAPPYTVGSINGFVANVDGDGFSSPPLSPNGESYKFTLFSTAVPGLEGNGSANQYRAQHGPTGWTSSLTGPTGTQVGINGPGGYGGDGGVTTFVVHHNEGRYSGTLDTGAQESHYLFYPDGRIQLVGEGTLPAEPDTDGYENGKADQPGAKVRWINAGGSHIIFENNILSQGEEATKLTPDAPEDGIPAVYDRTPSGLRVISLLPGNVTPTEKSIFEGSSADGSAVAFKTGETLYVRIGNRETLPVVTGTVSPGGISSDGRWVFYVKDGDIYRFDTTDQATRQVNNSGDATLAEVSADGSHVYFVSSSLLDGSWGTVGADNLYEWSGAQISFLATITPEDVLRQGNEDPDGPPRGLGKWSEGGASVVFADPAKNGYAALQTSRSTPSGSAFVFESTARLTGYDNAGKREVYLRTAGQPIVCISCDPSGAPASGEASLFNEPVRFVGNNAQVPNLSEAGRSVFFESTEGLVPADSNGVQDVYEWEDGHVYLLSAGDGSKPSYLTGATPDGSSVAISTTDSLVSDGQEQGIRAVYAVRTGGGFLAPEDTVGNCGGESCQGEAAVPPPVGSPASSQYVGPKNQSPKPKPKKKKHHKKSKHGGKKNKRKKHPTKSNNHAHKNAGGQK